MADQRSTPELSDLMSLWLTEFERRTRAELDEAFVSFGQRLRSGLASQMKPPTSTSNDDGAGPALDEVDPDLIEALEGLADRYGLLGLTRATLLKAREAEVADVAWATTGPRLSATVTTSAGGQSDSEPVELVASLAGGLLDDLAMIARENNVAISLNFTPLDEPGDGGESHG